MNTNLLWVRESIHYIAAEFIGAEVEQLTREPVISTNIYCEQRYTSGDGSHIALSRPPFA